MPSSFESTPLGAIVAADFRAAAVLDRFGLDFCCGGQRSLGAACAERGVRAADVETALAALGAPAGDVDVPDASWPADELTRLIVRRHHTYVREQLPIIAAQLDKLVQVHGARHPELQEVASHFGQLAADLQMHLLKEENILFPYVRVLAVAAEQGGAAPEAMFGSVRNPIRMMELEHRGAGGELEALRTLTANFAVPDDGCSTYRACFEALEAFDRDLRTHIHLENNVLFPKALALEAGLAEKPGRESEMD